MFIRYHIFFYALGCLLIVLGRYFHYLFYFVYLFYLYWLLKRLTISHVIICLFFSLLVLLPHPFPQDPSPNISGRVIKKSETYCYVKTKIGTIKLYHGEDLQYGDDIAGIVQYIEMNEPTNDYGYNEKLYLYGQKIFLKARLQSLKTIEHHATFYHFIEERLSNHEDVQSYQRLLLLGERDDGINEDYQTLSQLSLVHLFALSGMHIHILFGSIISIIGLFIDKRYGNYIAYLFIGFYVFSLPMQISLYRAFFMIVFKDIAKDFLNELDILSLLIIVSLIYNPYYIYNISFVFSYFIYLMVIFTKNMKYSYIYISLSSLPIVLSLNSQFSPLSLFIGMLMTPYIEFFYILCWISLLFPMTIPFFYVMVLLLKKMMTFIYRIQIPFLFSYPTLLFTVLYEIILLNMLFKQTNHRKIRNNVLLMISLLCSFWIYGQYKFNGSITMIDVGQGDCTLIRLPFNQGNILVDTGGNINYDIAENTIIPYLKAVGIHQLDYVYISHDDYDHSGALESLTQNFKIHQVINEYEEERKIGNISIRMLDHSSTNDNDDSLVMVVDFKNFRMLMTGDISQDVENELIEKYPPMDIDILKVSHHGSQTSTSAKFLSWVHPSIAMIGVGKNNLYHHPSENVIQRLKRKGITILRTDQDGMFHIQYDFFGNYAIYR